MVLQSQNVWDWASLSILTAIFPGERGLAGFIAAKDDGSGRDNWSNSQIVTINTLLLTGRMPSCHPINSVEALNGKCGTWPYTEKPAD